MANSDLSSFLKDQITSKNLFHSAGEENKVIFACVESMNYLKSKTSRLFKRLSVLKMLPYFFNMTLKTGAHFENVRKSRVFSVLKSYEKYMQFFALGLNNYG